MNERDLQRMKDDLAMAAAATWDAADAQDEMLAIARRQEAERQREKQELQRQQEAENKRQGRLQTVNHIVSLAKFLPQELAGASPDTLLLILAREAHYFGSGPFVVWSWLEYDAEFPHIIETAYDQIHRSLAPVLVATWNARKDQPASTAKTLSTLAWVFAYTSMSVMRTMRQDLIKAKTDFDVRHRDELVAMEAKKNEVAQIEAQLTAERSGVVGLVRNFWLGHKAGDPRMDHARKLAEQHNAILADFNKRKNALATQFVLERIDPQLRQITQGGREQ